VSARIALSSKLPADEETNGLDSLNQSLVDNPHQIIAALVWLDCPKITVDTESGDERPTVRVRRVEPFGTVDKIPAAVVKLALQLQEKRTGRQALPFDRLDAPAARVEIVDDEDDEPEF
jgi:hypothetical protein